MYCRTYFTLAIDTGADSEGRQEKHRRINKTDCEARARETAGERQGWLGGDNRAEPGGSEHRLKKLLFTYI